MSCFEIYMQFILQVCEFYVHEFNQLYIRKLTKSLTEHVQIFLLSLFPKQYIITTICTEFILCRY